MFEVSDIDRSIELYRDAFGLELHEADHEGEDRWTRGHHAATSWTDGAFMHFALYASRDGIVTSHAQIAFEVDDVDVAHRARHCCGRDGRPRTEAAAVGSLRPRYRDHDGNIVELTQQRSERTRRGA